LQHDPTARIIERHIGDDNHIFVFPSEVAGAYRLKQALFLTDRQAIRSDRFISWDRLKEREFSPHREQVPSNILFRTLFCAALLDEHRRKGPLLKMMAGDTADNGTGGTAPEAAAVFQHQLAAALPQMKRAVEAIEATGKHNGETGGTAQRLPAPLIHDLRLLYTRYLAFMDQAGLFEPAYVSAQGCRPDKTYHLFYPELIDDFEEYRPSIEGNMAFQVHSFTAGETGTPEGLLRFRDARQEVSWLISRLHRLMEEGVHPSQIAVTLPDYENWQPVLEEEAAVRDIPLDFRSGRMLSDYPAGRLFQRLSDLSRRGMGLETLKMLLLEPAYPWREKEKLGELVEFAIGHYFLANWNEEGRPRDELARKLKQDSREDLLKVYRSLKGQIAGLTEAPTAAELRVRVHTFLHTFFDTDGWKPEEERVLQYCLHVLEELESAEEVVHPLLVPSPYTLWTALMSRRVYVASGSKTAVPVYRYRVSAGICPRYHFIPGAGQGETRVRREEFAFLRDDYRSLLIRDVEVDASSDFLKIYAESGEKVMLSCSDRGFSGPQLPPSEHLAAGKVSPVADSGRNEPFALEELYWSRETDMPDLLFSAQRRGFQRMYAAGFASKGLDYTRESVQDLQLYPHMLKIAQGEKGAADGRIWLSPTTFDLYSACPFAYLLQKGMGLASEEYSILTVDHWLMGSILHRILAALYHRVQEEDGHWNVDRTEDYIRMAEELCSREFTRWERQGLVFAPPAWYWFTSTAREQVRSFVRQEGSQFDGFELVDTEMELAAECPGGEAGMWGRIDRMSRKEGKSALIDYKKGKVPAKADVYQEEGLPAVSQLVFYTRLAERNGHQVAAASYYSLQEGRYTHLFIDPEAPEPVAAGRKPRLQAEEFFGQVERIAAAVELQARRIRSGDFTARENCESCDFRTICRTKYALKLPEESHGS